MKAACMIAHRQEAGVEIPMFVTLQDAPRRGHEFSPPVERAV